MLTERNCHYGSIKPLAHGDLNVSHFTRMKTKLTDGDLVAECLDELGYSYTRGKVTINGYFGNTANAEFRIGTANSSYDIGLVRSNKHYEIVADWYGISSPGEYEFRDQLNATYAAAATKRALAQTTESLRQQRFQVAREVKEPDGSVRLVLRRTVG